jgi:DNA-binding NarL/FixJ family response regulator
VKPDQNGKSRGGVCLSLVLDLRMPKKDALQAITELMSSTRAPKPRIIVMATYEEEEAIHHTLSAGARGYLLKAAPPQYIRQAVLAAAGRESRFPTVSKVA